MKKLLLIHGWHWNKYSFSGCQDAWGDNKTLLIKLSNNCSVLKFNFPGFCGEPEANRPWTLDDYAVYLNDILKQHNFVPDIVLGYSFGGAVALRWKTKFVSDSKLVLVSPAIIRAYKTQSKTMSKLITLGKKIIPDFCRQFVRDIYLRFLVKNPYYIKGTKFLRDSYLNIVKIDLSQELKKIPQEEILLIFGTNDTITPVKTLLDRIGDSVLKDRIITLQNGNHNIIETHSEEITRIIERF